MVQQTQQRGSYDWLDSINGVANLRVVRDELQILEGDDWIKIYDGFDEDSQGVFFETWGDLNPTIVKKRLFMCDGTNALYMWTGARAAITSSTTTSVTFSKTLGELGFDSTTSDKILINGVELSIAAEADQTGSTITFAEQTAAPTVGSICYQAVNKNTSTVNSEYKINLIRNYQDSLVLASHSGFQVAMSDALTYPLSFTAPSTPTATSAIMLQLDSFATDMIARKEYLFVSTSTGWFRILKTKTAAAGSGSFCRYTKNTNS